MPKIKHSTLSGLVESDFEDSQFMDAMPTPDSAAENKAPGKKTRGRPKVAPAKVTKTKAPARRTSGRLTAKTQSKTTAPTKIKRQALADKTNQQCASETEEVDDFEQDEDVFMEGTVEDLVAVKKTKPKPAKKAAAGRGKVSKPVKEIPRTDYSIDDHTPEAPKFESRATRKGGAYKKQILQEPSPEKVVLESQVPAVDIGEDADEEVEQTISKTVHNFARPSSRPRSRSRPGQPPVQRRRAGSASDTERNDPALRRKLGEITKKYENLHLKYQDLRELGLKESERNFEKLKRHSEEKTKSGLIHCCMNE
jgi:hypothetical protein